MLRRIRALPEVEGRIETGAIRFGAEYPGVFVRADDAYGFCGAINQALQEVGNPEAQEGLRRLKTLLESCVVGADRKLLRAFNQPAIVESPRKAP